MNAPILRTSRSGESAPARLSIRKANRRFGSLLALQPIDLEIYAGEIHAVVGENGAGKSTLMNLIGGFVPPSEGEIRLDGTAMPTGNPRLARSLGIEMVHQHFMLVPEFTLEQNLELSLLGISKGGIQSLVQQVKSQAEDFGWNIPWDQRVSNCSVGIQQRVEILKTIAGNPKVVIFDEPTAVLSEGEIDQLFDFMRRLALQGKAVIVIAHKIREVLEIADRITVLRRGIHIATSDVKLVEPDELVTWMVGQIVNAAPEQQRPEEQLGGLQATGSVNFQVGRGEILGIGGVDGNGQLELSEALAGVVLFDGALHWDGSPIDNSTLRVGFVPQDRRADGLVVEMTIHENIKISDLNGATPEKSNQLIQQFQIKANSERDRVQTLSGGNQQKVILSRVLSSQPQLLIVVNPTRGLDVLATNFIHEQIRNAASTGTAVVLFSTDPDELNALSHRQLFMSRGQLFSSLNEALTA